MTLNIKWRADFPFGQFFYYLFHVGIQMIDRNAFGRDVAGVIFPHNAGKIFALLDLRPYFVSQLLICFQCYDSDDLQTCELFRVLIVVFSHLLVTELCLWREKTSFEFFDETVPAVKLIGLFEWRTLFVVTVQGFPGGERLGNYPVEHISLQKNPWVLFLKT